MEWTEFIRVPERTVRRAQIVMKGVCGKDDKFYTAEVQGADGLKRVMEYLSSVRVRDGSMIKDSTKQGYLSAISRILQEIGEDNACYREKVNEYEIQQKAQPKVIADGREKAVEILERLMYKCKKDVAVLAATIYYECDIQVKHLACTRCDMDVEGVNYFDLGRSVLIVKEDGKASKVINIPRRFTEFVKSLNLRDWLLGSERSPTSISNIFKSAAGCSHRDLRLMYDNDDCSSETFSVPNESSDKPTETTSSEHVKLCPKIRLKTDSDLSKLRPVIRIKMADQGIAWEQFNDSSCGEQTNKMRKNDAARLQKILIGKDDMFYYSAFVGQDSYLKIKAYMEGQNWALNTWSKYLAAICKMLADTNCGVADYRRYYLLYNAVDSVIKRKSKEVVEIPPDERVVSFDALVTKAKGLIKDKSMHIAVRILSLIVIESEDWQRETAVGIVRMSDLVRMQFQTGTESYIDMSAKTCNIRADRTKNKDARVLKLSDTFIDGLKNIYGERTPKWLISTSAGNCYETPNSFRKYIMDAFECSPGTIRSSYATYLHDHNVPMITFRRICRNMGHSHTTSVINYVNRRANDDD